MAGLRDAIVLVPGARIARQGEHLEVLINGLRSTAESVLCGEASPAVIAGLKGKRLPCTFVATGETTQVDLFERHILDLEGVDPAEAATRVADLTQHIETSFALTARLQQLSLLNYLT